MESEEESEESYDFELESIIWQEIHEWHESEIESERESTTWTPRYNGSQYASENPEKSAIFFLILVDCFSSLPETHEKEGKEKKCDEWKKYIYTRMEISIITDHNVYIRRYIPEYT
jgi:hypothetical protein